MGKYETTLKYVQMGKLLEDGDHEKALSLASEIDVTRVKELPDLKLLAEVYIANGIFDVAKEIYSMVYEELKTRRTLYKLIDLCIKSGDTKEAESLYQIYLMKDKTSIDRLTIRYRIDKANDVSKAILIKDLETILAEEYIEEWAYELAKVYNKAGLVDACIMECRKINVWFAGGEIAKKARKLMSHYDPSVVIEEEEEIFDEPLSLSESVEEIMAAQSMEQEENKEPAGDEYMDMPVSQNTSDLSDTLTDDILSGIMSELGKAEAEMAVESVDAETVAEVADDIAEVVADEEETITQTADIEVSVDDIASALSNTIEETISEAKATVEEEPVTEVTGLSKYGSELPYTLAKPMFRGIANGSPYSAVHFALASAEPSYYLTIVKKITKELQNNGYLGQAKIKISKIDAETLNTIHLDDEADELKGSCIMIENASKMSAQTINSVIKLMDRYGTKLSFILIDDEEDLSKMLFKEEILKNQIKYFVAL